MGSAESAVGLPARRSVRSLRSCSTSGNSWGVSSFTVFLSSVGDNPEPRNGFDAPLARRPLNDRRAVCLVKGHDLAVLPLASARTVYRRSDLNAADVDLHACLLPSARR